MAIRKQLNPRQMDLSPELRDLLMRNGMQAHIIADGNGYQLAVQGHDSPLLTYRLTEKQMLALTDWGTSYANKTAYNTFTSVVGNDFYLPKNFVHARNANGRVAMGLHGYRVGIGEYGRTGGYCMHPPHFLGWTPRMQDGWHLRRVGGQLFYPQAPMVSERWDRRMNPGELQSGCYGFYYKGQAQQPVVNQDVLQNLQAVVTPVVSRPRSNEPAKPYKELITSPVYFSNEKWQECLLSHGIIIDEQSKTLTIQSKATNVDMVYDLKDDELKALTDNSIKKVPIDKRLEILNNVIKDDFADKVTMDMLNSKERINIGLRPEVQQELDKRQQTVNEVGQDEELSVQQEIKLHGDASVNGQDLDLMDESKGWYREAKHGREVQVEEIYVERIEKPVADAAKQEQGKENDNEQNKGKDNDKGEVKYRMTAVINGEAISHEISQKQYDKFMAVDDYHRMKLFSNVFKEVDMKTRPGANTGLGTKIFAALTAGAVVTSEVAHGMRHHPHPEIYGERFEGPQAPRPYFKPGVDAPNEVAARNFEAQMNKEVTEIRRGY